MGLRETVLRFVSAARKQPAQASSPEFLNALEVEAFRSLDGAFFALNAPVSVYTWQVRTIMSGTVLQTNRIPFDFPRPVQILGFRSVVAPIPGQAAGPLDPASITGLATDVVDCQIDVDNSEFTTFNRNTSAPGVPNNSNFVLLSALDEQVPRIFEMKLTAPRPQLGFTFQWNLGIGTPWLDSLVTVAMFVRDLPGGGPGLNKDLRVG